MKRFGLIGAIALAGVVSCAVESYPESREDQPATAVVSDPPCLPVRSSESLPTRLVVSSSVAPTGTPTAFVYDLFNLFKSNCGGCHVDTNLGKFQVGPLDFPDKVGQLVVDRILSTDVAMVMPPASAGGKVASERQPGDPVLTLAALLQTWINAGRPRDVYTLPAGSQAAAKNPYLFSEDAADALTNIGACLPASSIVGTDAAVMDKVDAVFEKLAKAPPGQGTPSARVGLPERLEQTDLSTLDTNILARRGVIAFAPAYPLWSDSAGKLRHVRVPRGKSIRFNKDTQEFDIPENTRFYKTFLKQVVEVDGVTRYRKIETRLIVSRPDVVHPDGRTEVTALYGTYAWNEDETEALLVTDPLRNSEPFLDRLITYVTDEVKAAEVRAKKPKRVDFALQDAGVIRHYAIPGSERCVQCHMGASNASFVLGFTPLQIHRRPKGEGGVLEPAGPDELTQLQRLIDYKVITGIQSAADILPLEASQGDRKPRNDYELLAQGYMLGNCAHCHNPRGFPTVASPVLAGVVDFLPSRTGGIFQFPLDRVSPRISRGFGGSVPIPYITPSLMDYPSRLPSEYYTPKWALDSAYPPVASYRSFAPWRSLIYRNVDTPFTYSDDLALFPHMPMNTPGFDCRLPVIMAEWMISIPAAKKQINQREYAVPGSGYLVLDEGQSVPRLEPYPLDEQPQPYVEIPPSDPKYDGALEDAKIRLDVYRRGKIDDLLWFAAADGYQAIPGPSRREYCPSTTDIVDPDVLKDPNKNPVPGDKNLYTGNPLALVAMKDAVPDRAHWVVTDLSDAPGEWNPRRVDWKEAIVTAQEPEVVALLRGRTITPSLRDYATTPLPFGLWKEKAGCTFPPWVPRAGSFAAADRPRWMGEVSDEKATPPTAPVYTRSPGGVVFDMICINCHGPEADSHGRLSDNLLVMTGGATRVANFKDGLFGPASAPSANRTRVFGEVASGSGTAEDWGARYLTWMGLGGTQRTIPSSVLAIVGNTEVLGVRRKQQAEVPTSANMLSTAENLCLSVLSPKEREPLFLPTLGGYFDASPLIDKNGDAELWQRLCSLDNSPPVRALYVEDWGTPGYFKLDNSLNYKDLYLPDAYPTNAPVGNQRGEVVDGIQPDNVFPWCLRVRSEADQKVRELAYVNDPTHFLHGRPLPMCPDAVVPPSDKDRNPVGANRVTSDDVRRWKTRGAINAGFAVFLYLDSFVKSGGKPQPRYDQCELLH